MHEFWAETTMVRSDFERIMHRPQRRLCSIKLVLLSINRQCRRTRFQALLTKIGDCKYFFLIEEVMEVSFSGHYHFSMSSQLSVEHLQVSGGC